MSLGHVQLQFYLHGLIVLAIGLLGGLPFAAAIRSENGREVAWRVVHAGGASGGTMLIAMGSMLGPLAMSDTWNAVALVIQVAASYTLIGGMVLAAATGERGLGKRSGPATPMWQVVKVLYHSGVVLQIASVGLLLVVCARRLAD